MQKQRIYDIVVNNLPVGFSTVDKDGIVLDFNPAAETITGYSKEEVLGKPHLDILHGTSDENACPLHKHALQKREQTVATETVIKKKSGERIVLSVATSPLFDDQGGLAGGVELFRDITETKRLERERKNMLSLFAHDMKNPVMVSGGFVSRLLSGKAGALTDKQKNHLEIIRDELDRLAGLLTDFLEFSRFEAKEYKPVPSLFEIVRLCKTAGRTSIILPQGNDFRSPAEQ
jgi:PAS domain S-box-containing protein